MSKRAFLNRLRAHLGGLFHRPGWSFSPSRSGHIRCRHDSGARLITGGTPSDWRTLRNLAADMRRIERAAHILQGRHRS